MTLKTIFALVLSCILSMLIAGLVGESLNWIGCNPVIACLSSFCISYVLTGLSFGVCCDRYLRVS